MPICIAGMHRSGTSMVAKMLHLAGLWLGDEEELFQPDSVNEDGFFENRYLVDLNSDLLAHLGGGWDVPPTLPIGWELAEDLQPFRIRAADIVQHIGTREPWGWKDPRNTLTLPFWRQLLPDLRVVVCVRHPMEVARSLHRRGQSTEVFGAGLWLAYNKTALDIPSAARVVTHYEAYFEDPRAELQRVLRALDLPADDDTLTRGCAGISPRLRHNQADVPVPESLRRCYARLCLEAGPVYQLAAARHAPPGTPPDALGLAIVARRDAEQALEALRVELTTLQRHAAETGLRLEGELSQARIQLRESEAASRGGGATVVVGHPQRPTSDVRSTSQDCRDYRLDTARAMGADFVVAVNPVPALDPAMRNPLENALRRLDAFNPLSYVLRSRWLPNSFDVMAKTILIMQHELGNSRAGEADVLISPHLSRFWMLDFWNVRALVAEGAAAARAALPAIRETIAERGPGRGGGGVRGAAVSPTLARGSRR